MLKKLLFVIAMLLAAIPIANCVCHAADSTYVVWCKDIANSHSNTICFSPDDNYILVGGGNDEISTIEGYLILLDAQTGDTVMNYCGDTNCIMSAYFFPSGDTIISADSRGYVTLWDTFTGDSIWRTRVIDFEAAWRNYMIISPDGRYMIINKDIGNTDNIFIWDLQSKQEIDTLDMISTPESMGPIVMSPGGKYFATVSWTEEWFPDYLEWGHVGNVWVWETGTWEIKMKIKNGDSIPDISQKEIYDFEFAPNDSLIAFIDEGKEITIWNIPDSALYKTWRSPLGYDFLFTPDSRSFIISDTLVQKDSVNITVFDIEDLSRICSYGGWYLLNGAGSYDGNYFVTTDVGTVILFNACWNSSAMMENGDKGNQGIYPNPANESVKVRFNLEKSGNARVLIYDLLGNKVGELYNGALESGTHVLEWDTGNIAEGIYFCMVSSADGIITFKIMVGAR